MSYNQDSLDAKRRFATGYISPGRDAIITRAAAATDQPHRIG